MGVKHARLGETVATFLQQTPPPPPPPQQQQQKRPSDAAVQEWVREKLGRHKAPVHIFWLGEDGVPSDVPLTGSGKVKKFEMAKLAEALVRRREGPRL